MVGGMPVPARVNGKVECAERGGVVIECRDHVISLRDGQTAAGEKIVLYIDDQ
jgi:hypothetical protein